MRTASLDDLDLEIIQQLQYDGRLPFTTIAQTLGISEGSVRQRIKRLNDQGILQIVAIVEPQHLGLDAAAMVGVVVEPEQVDPVAGKISQFPEVSYLFMASGGFDLFVEVYCRNMEDLVSFLNDKLRQVPGIERTESFMILKMYKLSYRWGEAEPPKIHKKN
jgi:Lrp/AsnC family transcriptional regulator for asnA, asnC and gidA